MSARSESPLHQPALHESGLRHCTGEAIYVDDLPAPHGMLYGMIVPSAHAHARVLRRDKTRALQIPGVVDVLFADDVPGENMVGPLVHDEALFVEDEASFVGHTVGLVLAETLDACYQALDAVEVGYEELPALLSIQDAIAAESFLTEPHTIRRGDVRAALERATTRLAGETATPLQEHFYLETQVALALPREQGCLHVLSSSQHPSEVQKLVARACGLGAHQVVCEVPRMGGAFGGKESQAAIYACLAAVGAAHTGRPVKVWLDRDQDMCWTGKRHPMWARWEAGFDAEGQLDAFEVDLYSNGGFSFDLSGPVLNRALFHLDNAYFIPNLRFTGRATRTHLPSMTAFRGFGGPQGVLVVEDAISRYAELTGQDATAIRRRNFYGAEPRDVAPYGQLVRDCRLERIHDELLASSHYAERREAIEAFNATSRQRKRGLAFQPVKFGISFTKSLLNQAGALVLVYTDGTVQLNHGGTEMGQGLHTKMLALCAHELGVAPGAIRVMHTATDKVPNTAPTAASSGSDLNGQAIARACATLRDRMRPVAAGLLDLPDSQAAALEFRAGSVGLSGGRQVPFAKVAAAAWVQRVSLAATGYYATPGIAYDPTLGRGTPFYYYAYGAAVTEVEVSGLTGEYRLRRADILHDVGRSLLPTIDLGQVEGAYVQGVGWLTCEELLFDERGHLRTPGPSTYKIPALGDAPLDFRVQLLERAAQEGVIHGSKAVGEPPFMLGISAISALRHAIGSFAPAPRIVELRLPATPEAVLRAIEDQRGR